MNVYSLLMGLFVVVLFAFVWVSSDRFPHLRRQKAERTAIERKQALARRERTRREKAAVEAEWDTADDLPVVELAEQDPAA